MCQELRLKLVQKLSQTGLLLQENKCVSQCDSSYYVNPFSSICQKCDPSCQTCFGPSKSECSSCASGLTFLNNSCFDECPQNYYTIQQNGVKQCFECHRYCQLGCTGPSKEDCDSIKYQYQIIIFIFVGKSIIWIVSSIIGYFLDKRQSKTFNSIIRSPRYLAKDKKVTKISLNQEDDNQFQIQSQSKEQLQNQNANQQNQEENNLEENQIQDFLEQIMQVPIKSKSVIPRRNIYTNHTSIQVLEYQQTNQESNHQSQTKISSSLFPTVGTFANFNQNSNQQAVDNQGEENTSSQQHNYIADNKFKFTILGNEWVSLFYFYDSESTRFARALLIFLKYQAFFLSSELVYQVIATANLTYGDELRVISELNGLFAEKDVQWVDNSVFLCTKTDYSEFQGQKVMGIFGKGLDESQRTFSNLPSHWSTSLRLDLILYRFLDPGEYVDVYFNNQSKCYGKHSYAGGIYFCNQDSGYKDELILYRKNVTHEQSFIGFKLKSNTNEDRDNEGYAFKNVHLFVDTCHNSCLSCDGPTENQCTDCPLNSQKNGRTCKCNTNFYAYKNSCVKKCPKGFRENETSKLCVLDFCSLNCNTCENDRGQCLSCQPRFYLIDGYCVREYPSYSTPNCSQMQRFQIQNKQQFFEAELAKKQFIINKRDLGEDYEVKVPFQVLHAIGYTVHTVCPNKKAGDYVTCVAEEGSEIEKFLTYTEKIGHRFFLNYDFDQVKPEEYYDLVLAGRRTPEYLKYDPSVLQLVKHFTDSKKSILVICHGYQILCALKGCIEGIVLGGPTPTSYEISNSGGIYQQIKMEDALLYNNFISTPAYTGFLK
ncbi:hypothetical protein ABPG72_007853 [Tetrahymena utriculariae]